MIRAWVACRWPICHSACHGLVAGLSGTLRALAPPALKAVRWALGRAHLTHTRGDRGEGSGQPDPSGLEEVAATYPRA